MFLHLTPRELAVHADRHVDKLITIFFPSDVMAFSAVCRPILETPWGGRRFAGAFGAPFRPRTGHGSFVLVHDGAPHCTVWR
jgi:hypothetical protein